MMKETTRSTTRLSQVDRMRLTAQKNADATTDPEQFLDLTRRVESNGDNIDQPE